MIVPLNFDEHDLVAHVHAMLSRVLPITEGHCEMVMSERPASPSPLFGDQSGPVLYDSDTIYVYSRLSGIDRFDRPYRSEGPVQICRRTTRDLPSVSAVIEALGRVVRRVLADAQGERFSPYPLTLDPLDAAMATLVDAPAQTAEDCERRLLGARSLREILVVPEAQLQAARAAVERWLSEHSTVARTETFALTIADEGRVEIGRLGLYATFRAIVWGADHTISSVREQPVLLVPAAQSADPARVIAYLDAIASILPHKIAQSNVDTLLPYELFDSRVLELKRPVTEEAFVAALARRWKLV